MILYHRIIGNGQHALLFLHGFLEDHNMWNEIVPYFSNEYTCILMDLPGHGKSDCARETYSMVDMAKDVNETLKTIRIEKAHVFGHFMGGYVGLELLKNFKGSLTLVHSNFWEDDEEKKVNRDRVIDLVNKAKNLFIQEAIPGLFYSANLKACSSSIKELIAKAQEMQIESIRAATRGMKNRLANYDMMNSQRVSMIHGDNDPTIPNEKLELELSKLETIPIGYKLSDTGHMSIWENPKELVYFMKECIELP